MPDKDAGSLNSSAIQATEYAVWRRLGPPDARSTSNYVMMGQILIGVGLAVPDLPTAVAAALVFGTFVNPLLFVPLAFDPDVDKRLWYRALAVLSFLAVSGSLVVAAVVGPS